MKLCPLILAKWNREFTVVQEFCVRLYGCGSCAGFQRKTHLEFLTFRWETPEVCVVLWAQSKVCHHCLVLLRHYKRMPLLRKPSSRYVLVLFASINVPASASSLELPKEHQRVIDTFPSHTYGKEIQNTDCFLLFQTELHLSHRGELWNPHATWEQLMQIHLGWDLFESAERAGWFCVTFYQGWSLPLPCPTQAHMGTGSWHLTT